MKNKKLISRILLFSILATIVFGVYSQAKAQGEIALYLKERLTQQNVPVVAVTIIQKFPINLQITIQSTSDGEKASPEDPINLNLVRREVILANREGYFVERFVIVLMDNKGAQMARVEHSTEIADLFIGTRSSTMADEVLLSRLNDELNLYGMSLISLDISSSNGIQTANVHISTPSLDIANQALPQFMPSLRSTLENINSQGAQIVICKLELRDESGNLLLNYILDLQLRAENWWMADNLTQDWFPHP